MADGRLQKETGPGETHSPPLTREQFESTPEFCRFRSLMTELLNVSKAELDRRVEHARKNSPRLGMSSSPGRKKTAR